MTWRQQDLNLSGFPLAIKSSCPNANNNFVSSLPVKSLFYWIVVKFLSNNMLHSQGTQSFHVTLRLKAQIMFAATVLRTVDVVCSAVLPLALPILPFSSSLNATLPYQRDRLELLTPCHPVDGQSNEFGCFPSRQRNPSYTRNTAGSARLENTVTSGTCFNSYVLKDLLPSSTN